ncbi:MAG: hypothetical protein AAFY82_03510 [Pseudomonadota bacterium]
MNDEPEDKKNPDSIVNQIADAVISNGGPELIGAAIDAWRSAAEDALETTEELASAVSQKLGDVAGSAGETLGDAAEAAADVASNIDINL